MLSNSAVGGFNEQIDQGGKKAKKIEVSLLCLVFSFAPFNHCISVIIFPIMVYKSISIETRILQQRLSVQIWHKANHNCRFWMVTALALCVIFLKNLCLCMLSEVRTWLFGWKKRGMYWSLIVSCEMPFNTAEGSMYAFTNGKVYSVF